MHTYIVLFTVLIFDSVPVSAGLQEILSVSKCVADVHKELPNSCVFFMNSEEEKQGENNSFTARMLCFWEKNVLRFWVIKL